MGDTTSEIILGQIEIQSGWFDILRKTKDKVWVSCSAAGRQSVYGDIQAVSIDGEEILLECSNGFEASFMGKRVVVVKNIEFNATSYFFAPIGIFDKIHDKGLICDCPQEKGAFQDVDVEFQIRCIDVSPGGGLAVSCGDDQGLFVWQTENGVIRRTLDGHISDVSTCQFFPSGIVVLSGGVDMRLRIWSIEDGSCPVTLTGHTGAITSAQIVDRGRNVLSCSRDGTVRLWDCGSAKQLYKYSESTSVINDSSLIKYDSGQTDEVLTRSEQEVGTGNKLLCLAREDGYLEGLDLFTRKKVFSYKFKTAVNACCFINDTTLCAGLQDGMLAYFDIRNTSGPLRLVQHGKSAVTCLKEFPGNSVLVGKNDGTTSCIRHQSSSSDPMTTLELNGPECDTIHSIGSHNNFVYTACRDHKIRKYRLDLNT